MRLTLRNLLAYMDGNLRPEDSESIGKRIEESKFATDLYHKIRDVMRRIRLAAPSVNESSSNFDCNTVAEYLDNALHAERVVEFEEACLKSDMHLAEVAASHQILTVVQVEPAEIDPEGRQRMYQLTKAAQLADEERQAAAEAATMISGDGPAPLAASQQSTSPQFASQRHNAKSRPKSVVPEYLRESPRKPRLLLTAASVFIASAAIGMVGLAFGFFNPDKPGGRMVAWIETKLGLQKPVIEASANETSGKSASGSSQDSSAKSATLGVSTGTPAVNSSATLPNKAGDTATGPSVAGPALKGPDLVADNHPPAMLPPGAASGAAPTIPSTGTAPAAGIGAGPVLNVPGDSAPSAAGSGKPNAPMPTSLPKSVEVASAGGVKAPGSPIPGSPEPPTPDLARAAERAPNVGRFKSDGQDVLLKYEAATRNWRRVLPDEFLPAGQTLLALPSYRPRIDFLTASITLKMFSGTKLDLSAPNAQGLPGINLDYGHIVLEPVGQAGAGVRISLGGHSGTLTLVNGDTVAGVELTSIHEPGADPDKVPSHPSSMLYLVKGNAIWDEGNGKAPVRLSAPRAWSLDVPAEQNRESNQNTPEWLTINPTSDLDMRAAVAVSQALPADRPAPLVLMELADHPRIEIRRLAIRCFGHLGRFEPMVSALNVREYHSEWQDYINQLREAIARGPETARLIRAALETKFGSNAPALYRMLWGYTDQDLSNEEDARLVKYLDSEDLIFRVLAFTNLNDITGASYSYRPDLPPNKRASYALRWKQQLAAGKIRNKATLDKGPDKAGDKMTNKVKTLPAPTGGVALPEDTAPLPGSPPAAPAENPDAPIAPLP